MENSLLTVRDINYKYIVVGGNIEMNFCMVTVCCLAFNHEKTIRRAIDSILAQQTDFEFEVIVHDDASSDGTADIIKDYSNRYQGKVIGICQTNNIYSKKISAYYNFIFPMAKGRYLAFCECDDYWLDEYKLQKQVDFLESNPEYVACTHECLEVDQNGRVMSKHYVNSCFYRNYSLENCIERYSLSGQTATVLCRKEALELPTQEAIDDYSVMDCTGDVRMTLIMAIRGNIYHFFDIMSVYERNYENESSWSGKMKNTNLHIYYFNEYEQLEQFARKHLCVNVNFEKKKLRMTMHAIYRYILFRRAEDMESAKYMINKIDKTELIRWGGITRLR